MYAWASTVGGGQGGGGHLPPPWKKKIIVLANGFLKINVQICKYFLIEKKFAPPPGKSADRHVCM